MKPRRVLRLGAAAVLGVIFGSVVAVVGVVALALLVFGVFSTSEADHVRKDVQSQFGQVAHVTSCRKVMDDPVESAYRCSVTAAACTRSYVFVVDHEFGQYAATPASKSDAMFAQPCSVPSDR